MEKVIITGYTAQGEGVILETNIPARLKTGNVKGTSVFVSWDKIGRALLDDYADTDSVEDLRVLRGEQTPE